MRGEDEGTLTNMVFVATPAVMRPPWYTAPGREGGVLLSSRSVLYLDMDDVERVRSPTREHFVA